MLPKIAAAFLAIIAGSAGLQTGVSAQIPGLPKTAEAPAAETPEQTKARLQDWLKEAATTFARFDDPAAESRLPEGITADMLADRRRDLDQTVRTLNRTLSLIGGIPGAQAEVIAAQKTNTDWNGFPAPPPYSLLKLDDLINQRDATREKDATFKSSIAIFTKSFDGIEQETKAVDAAIREALEAAAKPDASEGAKWRLEAARAKSRLLTVRAFFIRSNIELLGKQSAASAAQLALLDREIFTVQKNAALTSADLLSIRKSADERRAALRDEGAKIRQRLKEASLARSRAKSALDELNEAKEPLPAQSARDLAATRLSSAEARVETLQFISDNLESFESLEDLIPVAYENRKALTESKNPVEREGSLESLRSFLNRLNAWEIVTANELAAANADLAKQDSNTSVIPPDDARFPLLAEQRKALWEKQDFLQRVARTITAHRRNISRWVESYEETTKEVHWYSRIGRAGRSLWQIIRDVWSFEVTSSTSTSIRAGVPITDTKSTSLGTIITAVTLFIIAYLFSARVSRRLQGAIVGRGHLAEAQANTMRTWLMILVSIGLALTTLKYFDIPLTVFAFFGGALAIGLGFGTQTLIKNFISGIIVLFERKIRVGDVIEIDANTSGKVVEINTRSSVLRNADGKETLVPNSLFLENRITNLTLSNRRVRRTIRVGVAYGTSPSEVAAILRECTERHGLILKEPAPIVTFEDFGDNALIFAIFFWVEMNSKTDASVVASDIRIMIEKRFDEAGIHFPYPQRDLHLKSEKPLQIELVSAPESEAPPTKKPIP